MSLIIFLLLTAFSLIITGLWVVIFRKEIKISDRLTTFIFLGSIPAAIKALTTKPSYYRFTGKYKNIIGFSFITVGILLSLVALLNYKYFLNY